MNYNQDGPRKNTKQRRKPRKSARNKFRRTKSDQSISKDSKEDIGKNEIILIDSAERSPKKLLNQTKAASTNASQVTYYELL